jgi:outer membrane protein assembly factor BamB
VDGDGIDEVAKSGEDGVVVLMDHRGAERWSREVDVDDHGIIRGMAMGDVDGDGDAEIAVAGTRYAAEQGGVVEVYDGNGTRLWSTLLSGASEDVEIADLDGDGRGEVVAGEAAGLDAECAVDAFEPLTGAVRWRTPVSGCLVPVIDIGNVDADAAPEIAYGDRTLASQPHLALLEADGSTTWNQGITDQVFWIEAIPGGLVHGGFTFGQLGAVTRRDAAGAIQWHTTLPDDQQFRSANRFATLVPEAGEGFSIAASADDGAVYLLDGQDGGMVWGTRLEPRELEFADRHPAGPIVLLPAHSGKDPRLVVGQYRTGRRRAATFALDLDGGIVGSAPMEGEAQAAAVLHRPGARALAVMGAGLGLYAFEA